MEGRHFLDDVKAQFRSLNTRGDRVGVRDGFPRPFVDKRYTVLHKNSGRDNHFQGIERIGRYLFITGSYPYPKRRSDLLVIQLDSRPANPGPWGSNLTADRDPPRTDRVVSYFQIDADYWHPGGLDTIGAVAVVPLERFDNSSVIAFIDLTNPAQPARLTGFDIVRPNAKAGALAITALADGRPLLAVWCDSDKAPDGTSRPYHLDIYLGRGPSVTNGFTMLATFQPPTNDGFHHAYQCLDFVWEKGQDGAGEMLYLIGFENTSETQPTPKPLDQGRNVARLYEVDLSVLPLAAPPANPVQVTSLLAPRGEREFETSDDWCNMDAGACAYVDSNQQLIVYSVYHFLAKPRGGGSTPILKCLEFRATDFAPISLIEDGWVELYEQPRLGGRRLSILGPWNASIADTRRAYVDDKRFETARSIRYQLPAGNSFVLYPKRNFEGSPALVLPGAGVVRQVEVAQTRFKGALGSCRLQLSSVAETIPGAVFA
jgi:hypothetical protein